KEVQVVDYPPPALPELEEALEGLAESFGGEEESAVQLSPAGREKLLKAALGLTQTEADVVLAKALLRDGALTDAAVDVVLQEKKQIVRRSGILEFYEAQEGLEDVGGLEPLKSWLRRRHAAFSEDAREYGLPVPRGILLLGVQGCGKSLTAKAISREWGMPLLRLDVGRVFGRYIGESEAAIRRVTQTAEAVAPAILWIDEIEKGFAGAGADSVDAGVSARVLGTFLTWLQEKRKPVFVFATANQIRNLPPELLRKGRFDELFFVDLPPAEERAAIFAVHLRRRRRDPAAFDLAALAARSEGFTGAEIEQVVNEGLYTAYADGRRALEQRDLEEAAAEIVPIASTMKESINAMRTWAAGRARRASSG
ncbi:MAG TPA: AAA family ATPase, partial [Armatimonadota bacterium]|nr:AAA family ATPase [Armatimonadota bacterium]